MAIRDFREEVQRQYDILSIGPDAPPPTSSAYEQAARNLAGYADKVITGEKDDMSVFSDGLGWLIILQHAANALRAVLSAAWGLFGA